MRAALAAVALAVMSVFAVAPAAVAAVSGPAAPAAAAVPAHAALASTQPADGSVVSTPPSQDSVTFDEAVGLTAGSLEVYSPGGSRVDNGQPLRVYADEIAVSLLPGIGDGTYTVVWHVISDDTHPVQGAFTFSIGAPSATHVGALLPSSDTAVSVLFAVARWLEYAFFAVLGGGVAFLILCWPDGAARRGVSRLIAASCAGLLVSTLCGLLLQGPYGAGAGLRSLLDPSLIATTLHSRLGTASEARELMAALAAGAASFLLPRLPGASSRRRAAAAAAWAVLVTGVAASWAVYDHASAGIQVPLGVGDDILHLDSMALWLGGLVVLAGFALRGPASVTAARAVRGFSAIALGCVTAIVASGVYQTWRLAGAWQALADTASGRLILAKIAGLLVLIGLGYLARRYIHHGSEDWAMRRLRRSVGAELAVAAAILAFSSLLVNTATGREAYAPTVSASQAFSTGGPGGSGTAHVFVGPARLGPNTVDVYFTTGPGHAFVPAQVRAALYFPAKGLGPLPVTLTRIAPGQYRDEDAAFTFTGQWRLQIVVRSDALDATSISFPVGVH